VPLPTWHSPRRHWQSAPGPQALAAPSRPRPRARCRLLNCRRGLTLSTATLPWGGPHPPGSLSPTGSRRAEASKGPLPPHLHGDAPALHGGEAVGQREARGANPVPRALNRVGLREVGTHGDGWPAASGAGERGATRAGAGAGAPEARVAGAGPAARPTQGAGERREAGQEAVTGQEQRASGSGNRAAPDSARPARRGAAGSHFLSNSPRPRGQRPAQPSLPRD
jgi:hypothetical protein